MQKLHVLQRPRPPTSRRTLAMFRSHHVFRWPRPLDPPDDTAFSISNVLRASPCCCVFVFWILWTAPCSPSAASSGRHLVVACSDRRVLLVQRVSRPLGQRKQDGDRTGGDNADTEQNEKACCGSRAGVEGAFAVWEKMDGRRA